MEQRTSYNKAAFFAMFAIIAVTTLLYGAVHQAVISMAYLMIFGLLLLWVVDSVRSRQLIVSVEPMQLVLYATALFGLIQLIPFGSEPPSGGIDGIASTLSFDPYSTQVAALHFLILAGYFSVALSLFDSAKRLKKFALFIMVFGAVFAFFAILQSLLSPEKIYGLLERPYAKPFGSFVSRNNFATWMLMPIAVPMGMLFTGSVAKEKRLLFLTAVSLMGVSLVASGSRGGLVALVLQVGFVLLITYSNKRGSSRWLQVVLGMGILVAIVAGTAFVGGESSLTRLGSEQVTPDNTVTRPEIWQVTARMIADNPVFGVGLGAYGVAYTRYDAASGFERVEQAHNDYLQVLADGGVVGGILGLIFLALLIRRGVRAVRIRNEARRGIAVGVLTGIFGVLVHSIFDFGLHTMSIAILFLTLIAVLTAATSEYEDDEGDAEDKRERRRRMV